jgi:CrcB protein
MKYLFIAIGGALGALSRYFVVLFFAKAFSTNFPLGTLAVNVVGSFIITLITTFFLYSGIDPLYRYLFITGFLGALTTFSSFTFETIHLLKEKFFFLSFLNVILNFSLSLGAGIIGIALGNYLFFK